MKFFCNGREWDTDAPVYKIRPGKPTVSDRGMKGR